MSGDLCQPHPTAKQKTSQPLSPQSRIPISSPSPLRRWGSLRARGEGDNPPFIRTPKISPEANQNGILSKNLQRGYSFMERGERRRGSHGVRPCTTTAPRPQTATTEPRNPGALKRAGGGGGAPQTPTRNRSLSLSLSNAARNTAKSPLATVAAIPKTPPSSPDTRHQQYRDWDLESVASTTSGLSVASCDHASVARNGTTFSGRSRRYVVHCSEHSGQTGEDYLTPTQRAHKEVKKLKYLLHQTQKELDLKDTDILRLTKEVVELRLYKAALNSPEDKSNSSSDAITVREVNIGEQDVTDCMVENHLSGEQTSSCADSGHYDDLTNSSVHSKDSVNIGEDISLSPYKAKTPVETADKAITVDLGPRDPHSEHQRLVVEYERRLQDLIRSHEEECHLMKQKHNDKVDELLQRLSEVNTRYWELVPDLESARERIKELEQQLEEACKKLEEQVNKHKETYLQMYNQGREAAKLEHDTQVADVAQENPSRISVPDLLHQLEVTQSELDKVKDLEYASSSNSMQPLLSAKEAVSLWVLGARKAMYRQLLEARSKNKIDPEITLQFLKSAIYYFLTDRENNQGHLRAIQSILGFTPSEISNIDKARMT